MSVSYEVVNIYHIWVCARCWMDENAWEKRG